MPKGRNKRLISLRDETLIRRYYYWTEIQRRRFDDALKILSEKEFFLSESRIMAIIRQNCDKLTDIGVKPVLNCQLSIDYAGSSSMIVAYVLSYTLMAPGREIQREETRSKGKAFSGSMLRTMSCNRLNRSIRSATFPAVPLV